jgi:uncharacterized protein (DUF1015 family)
MAHIEPFRALRYDPARVALANVVTQPYDKITAEMRDRYYAASPYNLVRIILGKQQSGDHPGENTYTRAAGFFRDWRRQGIFLQDPQPSIYVYSQRFAIPGGNKEAERRGFIALGRIEDYSAGVAFRHEQTLAKPKADRLELLRVTHAHFGQIFMLYRDPGRELESLLSSENPSDMQIRDEYGVLHQVWRVSDSAVVDLVRSKMRDKKLIIADGHHRYETALNYRNEWRRVAATAVVAGAPRERSSSESGAGSGPVAPYEQMMMTFINMDSPGLVILPTHRVVHGLSSFSPAQFRDKARAYFSVEEVDSGMDAERATTILREAGRTGTALLAVSAQRAFLLDRSKAFDSELFSRLSLRQRSLDVVQLHKCLLESVLGLSQESIRNEQNIRYVRAAEEALGQVHRGEANVAFLVNPVRMEQVRDIAFAGEVLPQKSTDFYPKLLSGLTIYALD